MNILTIEAGVDSLVGGKPSSPRDGKHETSIGEIAGVQISNLLIFKKFNNDALHLTFANHLSTDDGVFVIVSPEHHCMVGKLRRVTVPFSVRHARTFVYEDGPGLGIRLPGSKRTMSHQDNTFIR